MDKELMLYQQKMEKTTEVLEAELNSVRAGRANPHILDKIMIDYYGQPTPLQQMATVSVPEARLIQIQAWDSSMLAEIEKELNKSDIGIHPNNDGKLIRLNFPELTEDKRKELAKEVKKVGEETKVAIRNIRRDANQHFKKEEKGHEMTEDDLREFEDKVQEMTDKFIKKIDQQIDDKINEIMTL